MNEMSALREFRSQVPEPPEATLNALDRRVLDGLASVRRPAAPRPVMLRFGWRIGLATGLAAAVAAGVVVAQRPGPSTTPGSDRSPGAASTGAVGAQRPQLVSATQVLDLAANAAQVDDQLAPRGDQFIVYESITMYPSMGPDGRYLYRTKRTTWTSVDGTRNGAVRMEYLTPAAYPGWPIPSEATRQAGQVQMFRSCATTPGATGYDYVHLRTLPTDPDQMLAYLASIAGGNGDHNLRLWKAAGELLRETYLPPAQRAALYRAIMKIPGVTLVAHAEDAAGRQGIGVGITDGQQGVQDQLIFDADSYRYLGERAFVVDAATAQAPVGSQLAATAQLSIKIADEAPAVDPGPKGDGC